MDGQPVERWATALTSGHREAQVTALRQISSCDVVTQLTVPIVRLAGSDDDEIRMWAAEAMENAVSPTPPEAPELAQLLIDSSDGEICYWAATMLGRLGGHATTAVNALEMCLLHGDYLAARERAVWALSQIGPAATVTLPSLARISRENHHPRLQRLALLAIERLRRHRSGQAA